MEKIFLRPLLEEDVIEKYLSWFKDPEVTNFLEVDGNSLTKQKVIDYIEEGKKTKTYYMYAVCLTENKKQIGNIKVGPINHKHGLSDLVVVIGDKKYWGKGLASEAIKKGMEIAFKEYNIRKLSGSIHSGNAGSIKAYTNAGWFIEGTLKDQFVVNGEFHDRIMVGCFNPKYYKKRGKTNG